MINNVSATLDNNRESAKANVCLFRCSPRDLPFSIKLLERHLYSTQMFIPMTADKRYLVIVAQGGDKPGNHFPHNHNSQQDLSTLKAFVASKSQGITYYPGTWHHPMIALDNVTGSFFHLHCVLNLDFTCVVYEDGSQDDCHVEQLDDVITCYVN